MSTLSEEILIENIPSFLGINETVTETKLDKSDIDGICRIMLHVIANKLSDTELKNDTHTPQQMRQIISDCLDDSDIDYKETICAVLCTIANKHRAEKNKNNVNYYDIDPNYYVIDPVNNDY